MSVTTLRMIPSGLLVHQQRTRHNERNPNVDIKFSVHDTFLE